jgi:tetratricopeptide (TPR) repeat protein
MLRHRAFFEELASLEETDQAWRSATAGLLVLRLIDAWIEDGVSADAWTLRNIDAAISEIDEGSILRGLLEGVAKAVRSEGAELNRIVSPLMAYAQALEYDAKWRLAGDVYLTLLSHLHPTSDAQAVANAYIRLGMCHRNLNEIDEAEAAFASAGQISAATDDMEGILRARLGEARVAFMRGNFPQAEHILESTISDAKGSHLIDVRSRALHDRSEVAQMRGEFELAIRLAYDAMQTSQSQRERDRILGDIATAFLNLGVYSAARDAYLVLSVTAQEQYVRWTALLNLLDVESSEGHEVLFEQYRRQLSDATLPPGLVVAYDINVGEGYQRFGNLELARRHFEHARDVAIERGLNRVLFMAEERLEGLAAPTTPKTAQPVPLDLGEIATAVREMREAAGAA